MRMHRALWHVVPSVVKFTPQRGNVLVTVARW
jgi:hypothetical protein